MMNGKMMSEEQCLEKFRSEQQENNIGKKIVIFGVDNSGKTTLSEKLKEIFPNYQVKHSPGPVPADEMVKWMDENVFNPQDLICDRFPLIEEGVIGPILRGTNVLKNVDSNRYYNNIDLFIFCNPGLDKIQKWGTREQMNGIKENVSALYDGYYHKFRLLSFVDLPVVEYDWNNIDDILRRVKEI